MSRSRLAGPELVKVFRGFSTPRAAPATINTMCEVLQQEILPGAVISHTTAAALIGIALPWWVDRGIGTLAGATYEWDGRRHLPSTLPAEPDDASTSLDTSTLSASWQKQVESGLPLLASSTFGAPSKQRELTTPPRLHCRLTSNTRRTAGPNVVVHRMTSRARFPANGIELSHPYAVLLELATMLDHDDLVIAIDSLVSRTPPLGRTSVEKISKVADIYDGAWGAPALRRAVKDARANTDSPGETRTRLLLRRAGFPEPVLNHPVEDPDSDGTRYIDLAYPDLKIGIEYDGDYHRQTTTQRRKDQARLDSLASIGWNIRSLNAEDIKKPGRFLEALRRTFLTARADAPPSSNWSGRTEKSLGRSLRPPEERSEKARTKYGTRATRTAA